MSTVVLRSLQDGHYSKHGASTYSADLPWGRWCKMTCIWRMKSGGQRASVYLQTLDSSGQWLLTWIGRCKFRASRASFYRSVLIAFNDPYWLYPLLSKQYSHCSKEKGVVLFLQASHPRPCENHFTMSFPSPWCKLHIGLINRPCKLVSCFPQRRGQWLG